MTPSGASSKPYDISWPPRLTEYIGISLPLELLLMKRGLAQNLDDLRETVPTEERLRSRRID
jgi:hypothetical protein